MTENTVSIFGAYKNTDFEQLRPSDIITPRLTLMQFASKPVKDEAVVQSEIKDAAGKIIAPAIKAGAGMWIESSGKKLVCDRNRTVGIIPITFWVEWVEWNPDRNAAKDKKILGHSADPNSELAKAANARMVARRLDGTPWLNAKGKEQQRVTESYSFLVACPEFFGGYEGMMMLSMSRSAHYVGKQWLNRIRMHRTDGQETPMPAVVWQLGSEKQTKESDDFMVPTIGAGTLLPLADIPIVLEIANKMRAQKELFQRMSAQHEAEAATDDSEAAAKPVNPEL